MAVSEQYAIIITTVNHPTRGVMEIARDAPKLGAQVVLIGDQKSPPDFMQPGATYLDLAAQRAAGFKYAQVAPARHYARKNVGYLVAMRHGATIIVETDDDNIPASGFWQPRRATVNARVVDADGWVNVYAYFSEQNIWPRGLPLRFVNQPPPAWNALSPSEIYCPIQQGLADGNPDVDAIYRFVLALPLDFLKREPIALRGAWCPFNSQNTTFWREAFPLLYLPYCCSFRMTDIWRGFVAQRIAYLNGWGILFHNATVFQERNEHDLLRDFEEEIPGYLQNERIRDTLEGVDLPRGAESIPVAMRLCYRELVSRQFVGEPELALLDAWLDDLAALGVCR
jgi:hypothetical protein